MQSVTQDQIAVKCSTAARMLDCGATKIYELEKSGDLVTIKIGADKRITVESIKHFVQRQIASAGDANTKA